MGPARNNATPIFNTAISPVVIASADHFIATVLFKYICLINFPSSAAQDALEIPFDYTKDPMNSLANPSKFRNES